MIERAFEVPVPGGRPPPPRWRRWVLGLAIGVVALFVVGLLAMQRPAVATAVVNLVLARLPLPPRTTLEVEEARGDWLTHLELRGLRMSRQDTLLAAADTIRARYRLASLLVGWLDVKDLEFDGVVVAADIATQTGPAPRTRRPPPTLADLLRGRFYSGLPLRLDRLTVEEARYRAASDSGLQLAHVAARARRIFLGRGFSFLLDTLRIRVVPGADTIPRVECGLAATLRDGRFEVRTLRVRGVASRVDARGLLALDARDSLAEA